MRTSRTRNRLLSLLGSSPCPVSANELHSRLKVNKTTIYRQLESLTKEGLIDEIRFTDRKLRYEPAGRDHHHHLVCDFCGTVKDIPLDESVLMSQLSGVRDFHVTRHSLEFFGLCSDCQSL